MGHFLGGAFQYVMASNTALMISGCGGGNSPAIPNVTSNVTPHTLRFGRDAFALHDTGLPPDTQYAFQMITYGAEWGHTRNSPCIRSNQQEKRHPPPRGGRHRGTPQEQMLTMDRLRTPTFLKTTLFKELI